MATGQIIGSLTNVQGTVQIKGVNGETRTAQEGEQIAHGEQVIIAEGSNATLAHQDGSQTFLHGGHAHDIDDAFMESHGIALASSAPGQEGTPDAGFGTGPAEQQQAQTDDQGQTAQSGQQVVQADQAQVVEPGQTLEDETTAQAQLEPTDQAPIDPTLTDQTALTADAAEAAEFDVHDGGESSVQRRPDYTASLPDAGYPTVPINLPQQKQIEELFIVPDQPEPIVPATPPEVPQPEVNEVIFDIQGTPGSRLEGEAPFEYTVSISGDPLVGPQTACVNLNINELTANLNGPDIDVDQNVMAIRQAIIDAATAEGVVVDIVDDNTVKLTFNSSSNTSFTFNVQAILDQLPEDPETFGFNLEMPDASDGVTATIDNDEVISTILDNTIEVEFNISGTPDERFEGDPAFVYEVEMVGDPLTAGQTACVNLNINELTANLNGPDIDVDQNIMAIRQAIIDAATAQGIDVMIVDDDTVKLTFDENSNTSFEFEVSAIIDQLPEGAETFGFTLDTADGSAGVATTIGDDEVISTILDNTIEVEFNISGTPDERFEGDPAFVYEVEMVGDPLTAGQTACVNLNINELTANLNGPDIDVDQNIMAIRQAIIDAATAQGIDVMIVDDDTVKLTFDENSNTSFEFEVSAIIDQLPEGAETFGFTLDTVDGSAGVAATIGDDEVISTILDNTIEVEFNISGTPDERFEGDPAFVYEVEMTGGPLTGGQTACVNLNINELTANLNGPDIDVDQNIMAIRQAIIDAATAQGIDVMIVDDDTVKLTFDENSNTTFEFDVTALHDKLEEGAETFGFNLDTADGSAGVAATIGDDEVISTILDATPEGKLEIDGCVFEDGKPDQHLGDNSDEFTPLNINFTSINGSELVDVTLKNIPDGFLIKVNGVLQNIVGGELTIDGADIGNVTVQPAMNDSDVDIVLDFEANITDPQHPDSCQVIEGQGTIVVDAVADKPEVDVEVTAGVDGVQCVAIEAQFFDYEDGSETHIMQFQVPEDWSLENGITVNGMQFDGPFDPALGKENDPTWMQIDVTDIVSQSDGKALLEYKIEPPDTWPLEYSLHYNGDDSTINGGENENGGDINFVNTSFNDESHILNFEMKVTNGPHGNTDGFTLVINNGPNNPKGEDGLAIIYVDNSGPEPIMTIYPYNGENNFSSFMDSDPILSSQVGNQDWLIDFDVETMGDMHTFNFSIDTNFLPNDATAEFTTELGMWLHTMVGLDVQYDNDGDITSFNYDKQGWLDTYDQETKVEHPDVCVEAMAVAIENPTDQEKPVDDQHPDNNIAMDSDKTVIEMDVIEVEFELDGTKKIFEGGDPGEYTITRGGDDLIGGKEACVKLKITPTSGKPATLEGPGTDIDQELADLLQSIVDEANAVNGLSAELVDGAVKFTWTADAPDTFTFDISAVTDKLEEFTEKYKVQIFMPEGSGGAIASIVDGKDKVVTKIIDTTPEGEVEIHACVAEDGKPNQHLGDNTDEFVKLEINFTPVDNAVLQDVTLMNIPVGVIIKVDGVETLGTGNNSVVIDAADLDKVEIQPPMSNSDVDFTIDFMANIINPDFDGACQKVNGEAKIVVDAVADKPEVDVEVTPGDDGVQCVKVDGQFFDLDGSEMHHLQFQVPEDWELTGKVTVNGHEIDPGDIHPAPGKDETWMQIDVTDLVDNYGNAVLEYKIEPPEVWPLKYSLNYDGDESTINGGENENAGDINFINTCFNDESHVLDFEMKVTNPQYGETDGLTLVLNDGPNNPKGEDGLAIIYIDNSGPEPIMTIYPYNGENNQSSFMDSEPLLTTQLGNQDWLIDFDVETMGNMHTFNFSIDTNFLPNDATAEFGSEIGIWLHTFTGLDIDYDNYGDITSFNYDKQGWLDTHGQDTEVEHPDVCVEAMAVATEYPTDQEKSTDNNVAMDNDKTVIEMDVIEVEFEIEGTNKIFEGGDPGEYTITRGGDDLIGGKEACVKLQITPTGANPATLEGQGTDIDQELADLLQSIVDDANAVNGLSAELVNGAVKFTWTADAPDTFTFDIAAIHDKLDEPHEFYKVQLFMPEGSGGATASLVDGKDKVVTKIIDKTPQGELEVDACVFEDGKPNQHLGDNTDVFAKLNINFTPDSNETLVDVTLKDIPEGVVIKVGNTEFVSDGNNFDVTIDAADINNVYIQPAMNDSDVDFHLDFMANITNPSDGMNMISGSGKVIVDAVADKPEVDVSVTEGQGDLLCVKVEGQFFDLDGSEKHILQFQIPEGFELDGNVTVNGHVIDPHDIDPAPGKDDSWAQVDVSHLVDNYGQAVLEYKVDPTLECQTKYTLHYNGDESTINGGENEKAGDINFLDTCFNEDTGKLDFEMKVTNGYHGETEGFTLVINDGPNNPKGEDGLAIIYFDNSGPEPIVTIYPYNGENNQSSFMDSEPLLSSQVGNQDWLSDLNVESMGKMNTFSFSIDTNALPNNATAEFNDEAGIWLHTFTGLDIDYDNHGDITDFDYHKQGWLDTYDQETEVEEIKIPHEGEVCIDAMAVAIEMPSDHEKTTDNNMAMDSDTVKITPTPDLDDAILINEIGLGVGTSPKHGYQNFIELKNVSDQLISKSDLGTLTLEVAGLAGTKLDINLSTLMGDADLPAGSYLTLYEDGEWTISNSAGMVIEDGSYTTGNWDFGADTTAMLGANLVQGSNSIDTFLANGVDPAVFTDSNWSGQGKGTLTAQSVFMLGAAGLIDNDTFNGQVDNQQHVLDTLGIDRPTLKDTVTDSDNHSVFSRTFMDPQDVADADSNGAQDWTTNSEATDGAVNHNPMDLNPEDNTDDNNPAQGQGSNADNAGQTVAVADQQNPDLMGGRGPDHLYGDANDNVLGDPSLDAPAGDEHNDLMFGDKGDDELYGGRGADLLVDVDGCDMLVGNNGNDTLIADARSFDGHPKNSDKADVLIGDNIIDGNLPSFNVSYVIDVSGSMGRAEHTVTAENTVDIFPAADSFRIEGLPNGTSIWNGGSQIEGQAPYDVSAQEIENGLIIQLPGSLFAGGVTPPVLNLTVEAFDGNSSLGDVNLTIDPSTAGIVTARDAFVSLHDSIVESGIGAATAVQVVAFNSSVPTDIIFDSALNASIVSTILDLTPGGGTQFESPLNAVEDFLRTDDPDVPGTQERHTTAESNLVFFLSDGQDNNGFDSNAVNLNSPNPGIDVEIRAFGLGLNPDLSELQDIADEGNADSSAQIVTDPNDLEAMLLAGPLPGSEGVGEDVIIAGDKDDVIFGDNVNIDFQRVADNHAEFANSDAARDAYDSDAKAFIESYVATDEEAFELFGTVGKGDWIDGGKGNDLIFGQGGDDEILGGRGHDTLYGGSGDDTITGNAGEDVIVTGSGRDTVVFLNGQVNETDSITDFNKDEDSLNLSDVLNFDDNVDNISDYVQVDVSGNVRFDIDGNVDNTSAIVANIGPQVMGNDIQIIGDEAIQNVNVG